MKIYYYTICWGENYLNSLFNLSLKSFFSNKFKSQNNTHKIFIYTDNPNSIKINYKKNINDLKKKNLKIELINYKKKINLFKTNKKSVWRFLGNFQKKALKHAKRNNAIYGFIYPDEIHSENLSNFVVDKINYYDFVFTPSNEVYLKNFKNSKYKKITKKNLLNIKIKNLENYNKKDFLNYNFYTKHQTRAYFKIGKSIFYKSIHLSPMLINPKKIKDINKIYTLDASLNDSKNSYIVDPNDALLLSLEKTKDFTRNYKHTSSFFKLYFLRLIYYFNFNIKNINGINPFLYLKTYRIPVEKKSNFNLKKVIFFDLFFFVIFILSSVLKFFYNLKKFLKY